MREAFILSYKSIYGEATDRFIVEKSEFIGAIAPVKTEDEAVGFIDRIRSENRKARHNCYAYVLKDGNISRYSDDGEPQGTAGPPIMDVIEKNGLCDVAIVVTRYFGGILLGKGGLTRAYSKAASIALGAAKIMELFPAFILKISADYSHYDKIAYVLPDFDARLIDTEYTDRVTITLAVKSEMCDNIKTKLMDITNGGIILCSCDETEFNFS